MTNLKTNTHNGVLILLVLLFVAVGVYAYANTRAFFRGTVLTTSGIEPYATYTDPLIHITGTATNAHVVRINGVNMAITPEGEFAKPLLLAPGYNIIEVYAEDKFGNVDTQKFPLILRTNG